MNDPDPPITHLGSREALPWDQSSSHPWLRLQELNSFFDQGLRRSRYWPCQHFRNPFPESLWISENFRKSINCHFTLFYFESTGLREIFIIPTNSSRRYGSLFFFRLKVSPSWLTSVRIPLFYYAVSLFVFRFLSSVRCNLQRSSHCHSQCPQNVYDHFGPPRAWSRQNCYGWACEHYCTLYSSLEFSF